MLKLVPTVFEVPWRVAELGAAGDSPGAADEAVRELNGELQTQSGAIVDTSTTIKETGGGVDLAVTMRPRRELRVNSMSLALTFPTGGWAGGKVIIDGRDVALPRSYGDLQLWAGTARGLTLIRANGEALTFTFATPTQVRLQDNRRWTETFTLRLEAPNAPEAWPAGRALEIRADLSSPNRLRAEMDGAISITAGKEWVPLDDDLEVEPGSAIDFSGLISRPTPAGNLGRVIADATGHFVFANAPSTPLRFYGVNLCFDALYLPHDQADRLAERLRRLGYNSVRVHHYESALRPKPGEDLDATALDQLDYLCAALKSRGLFIATDLFVSRPVAAALIYEGESGLMNGDEYKLAVHFNERAYADFIGFARKLLTHRNPHTGLTWAEDPVIAWLGLINEDNPNNFVAVVKGPLRADIERAWNTWLAETYPDRASLLNALGPIPDEQSPAAANIPIPDIYRDSPAAVRFNVFLAENERRFFRRTRQWLREEVGCQALLSDITGWSNPVQLQAIRRDFDFVDDHFYIDHPRFLGKPWKLPAAVGNDSPVAIGAWGGRERAFTRLYGKPFTISEFNYAGPSRYRAVGGVLTGAVASIQDWDGLWRFEYSQNRANLFSPGPIEYFSLVSDPLNLAADRATLCLFLRRDLQAAPHNVAIVAHEDDLLSGARTAIDRVPRWHETAWLTRGGWKFLDGAKSPSADLEIPFDHGAGLNRTDIPRRLRECRIVAAENRSDPQQIILEDERRQVLIDGSRELFVVDTPRTAGGFARAGAEFRTASARFIPHGCAATVWISSVDGAPISESRRLLLTHLTDLQNSGIQYGDRSRQILVSWGALPHLVQAGAVDVELSLQHADRAVIYRLSMSGRRLRTWPVKSRTQGKLTFEADVNDAGTAGMLYEIVVDAD